MSFAEFERSIRKRAKKSQAIDHLILGLGYGTVLLCLIMGINIWVAIGMFFAAVYGVVRLIRLILTHE